MNSRFFSDSKVNAGRQQELDLLKALCVVGMIFVHVLLDMCSWTWEKRSCRAWSTII